MKNMKNIFGSKRLEQAMRRSFSATSLYPSNHFAFQQGWRAACKFLERVYNAEEICCQCGKLLYEGDNYFIYDEVGCFCEKCMNKIEKESKKMSEIKINEGILNYINNYKPPFEFIPKLGSLWKVEQEVSYPNVNGGYPVIELSNSKGEWLRLPKNIIDNERTKI